MHDIDKIVSSRCAETEEGQKRRRGEPVATKTAEAHLVQYIDRVVDVPVDEEPGDTVHAGTCCTKRHNDEKAFTDIPPYCIGTSAVQAQTTENLADD